MNKQLLKLYKVPVYTAKVSCAYCDGPATLYDHFFPVSKLLKLYMSNQPIPYDLLFLVPSCSMCNARAAARVFKTIEEKRAFIQKPRLPYYKNTRHHKTRNLPGRI